MDVVRGVPAWLPVQFILSTLSSQLVKERLPRGAGEGDEPGQVARRQATRAPWCQAEVLDVVLRALGSHGGLEAGSSHGQMWSCRDVVGRAITWLPLPWMVLRASPGPHLSVSLSPTGAGIWVEGLGQTYLSCWLRLALARPHCCQSGRVSHFLQACDQVEPRKAVTDLGQGWKPASLPSQRPAQPPRPQHLARPDLF